MLQARRLACIRGGRHVFNGLEFDLEKGEVLTLQGPNGSGKSSLLRVLAGFLTPALGVLTWDGEDVAKELAAHRARLHYIGHADGIKSLLSVRENIHFTCTLNGAAEGGMDQALTAFDLKNLADTPGRFLSSGQRRRLSLARLVADERPLWLLDEPGVGLDTANRQRLENAIKAHRDRGGITILATHGDVRVEDSLILTFERR